MALINRIYNLAGPVEAGEINNINNILENSARQIIDLVSDEDIFENFKKIYAYDSTNMPFDIREKRILAVLRADSNTGGLVECEQASALEIAKYKSTSGSLDEATEYSPAYSIQRTTGTDIPGYYGAIQVYPEPSRDFGGEIWYIDLPSFPEDIDCWGIDSLLELVGTEHAYWNTDMEGAFIVKSALDLLIIKLSDMNITEEDSEVSNLISSSIAQLTSEYENYKKKLQYIDNELDTLRNINNSTGAR